jgi:hypothetical protein
MTNHLQSKSVIRRAADHLSAEVDGEVMLMSIEHSRYLGLNDIGSDIWRRLERPQTFGDLCGALKKDYVAAFDVIESDVRGLLTSLQAYGLLELS